MTQAKIIFLLISVTTLSSCFKWAARAKDKLPDKTAINETYTYPGGLFLLIQSLTIVKTNCLLFRLSPKPSTEYFV